MQLTCTVLACGVTTRLEMVVTRVLRPPAGASLAALFRSARRHASLAIERVVSGRTGLDAGLLVGGHVALERPRLATFASHGCSQPFFALPSLLMLPRPRPPVPDGSPLQPALPATAEYCCLFAPLGCDCAATFFEKLFDPAYAMPALYSLPQGPRMFSDTGAAKGAIPCGENATASWVDIESSHWARSCATRSYGSIR